MLVVSEFVTTVVTLCSAIWKRMISLEIYHLIWEHCRKICRFVHSNNWESIYLNVCVSFMILNITVFFNSNYKFKSNLFWRKLVKPCKCDWWSKLNIFAYTITDEVPRTQRAAVKQDPWTFHVLSRAGGTYGTTYNSEGVLAWYIQAIIFYVAYTTT